MGRNGVSYLDISKAAFELQGRGINPTVDAVREILGTGSKSTIGPYLKQWRNKQEEGGQKASLPQELSSVVKGLYIQLQEKADAKVNELTAALETSFREKQQLEKDWLIQRGKIMELQEKINIEATLAKNFENKYTTMHNEYLYSQETISRLEETLKTLQNEKLYLIRERVTLASEIKKFEKDMALA